MNRFIASRRAFLGFIALSLALIPVIGCEEGYSALITYPLRTDPLPKSDKFGDDRPEPDAPAQLPLMSIKDIAQPGHPMFPLKDKLVSSGVLLDPASIKPEDRKEIKGYLDSWFGTPRNPKVKDAPSSLQLDDTILSKGSSLYRVHCLHCHGISGDGRGVTAKWINPHPRDFRQSMFKFQAVDQISGPSPPRRDDLRRTLVQGIEGTAMPAFNLLPKDEIDALISYVIHLSIRGKVEYDTMKTFEGLEDDLGEHMGKLLSITLKNWEKAPSRPIKMKPYPYPENDVEALKASVRRGYLLFTGQVDKEAPEAKGTNCVSCHKNFGREASFKWDQWGTLVRPNNLTNGLYRGGRRPQDIYNRIHSGINGSGMPPFGGFEAKDEKIVWDLVNFVQVLPYPAMREKLGIKID